MAAAVVRTSALAGSAARPTKSKKSASGQAVVLGLAGDGVEGLHLGRGPDGLPAVQLVEGADVVLDWRAGARSGGEDGLAAGDRGRLTGRRQRRNCAACADPAAETIAAVAMPKPNSRRFIVSPLLIGPSPPAGAERPDVTGFNANKKRRSQDRRLS
jgi:hypothetical protein